LSDKKTKRERRKNAFLRFFEYKIIHIDDSPHKIALGLALGLFIAWNPLFGLHILMVIFLSILLRANKFAALVSVCVSNIFTIPFVYYPAYLVGRAVYGFFFPNGIMSKQQVSQLFTELFVPSNMLANFHTREYWRQFLTLSKAIGPELWIGCFLLGGFIALCSYIICYNLVRYHRARNPHRRYGKYLDR
jgi:hypothetical protein